MLRDWKKEEGCFLPKEKTGWELEELQQTIQQAARTKNALHLTLWQNTSWHNETEIITAIDTAKRELLFETKTTIKRIPLSSIYAAKLMDEYDD
ncbi:YolD-like family protein [Lysinibacillus xylanilyticus]|uniref:YolD-like family protein n=1 Tax=Lysinibacillus xylanilyticus TaxID=582475 RepID=UPI002B247892|nr:YolD-like family protein [Lysinibacillus xylanilyticus]MEB2278755.1 YolD-like family protein [Lysinibacillus xylanilyticus]